MACMKATVSTGAVQKYIPSCKTNGPILWAVMCAMCIPLESISQEKDRYRESVCDGEYEVSSNVIAEDYNPSRPKPSSCSLLAC